MSAWTIVDWAIQEVLFKSVFITSNMRIGSFCVMHHMKLFCQYIFFLPSLKRQFVKQKLRIWHRKSLRIWLDLRSLAMWLIALRLVNQAWEFFYWRCLLNFSSSSPDVWRLDDPARPTSHNISITRTSETMQALCRDQLYHMYNLVCFCLWMFTFFLPFLFFLVCSDQPHTKHALHVRIWNSDLCAQYVPVRARFQSDTFYFRYQIFKLPPINDSSR